jgi:hypothetical protein
MKNLNFNITVKLTAVFLFLIFIINPLKAQTPSCNYGVTNNGSCVINVTVVYMDMNGVCSSQTSNITALNTMNFNCGGCLSPLMDVIIYLNSVDTNPLSTGSGFVNQSSNTDSGTIGGSGCFGSSNYTMNWNSTNTQISY